MPDRSGSIAHPQPAGRAPLGVKLVSLSTRGSLSLINRHPQYSSACLKGVESRCGAVALGRTYLLPPLSSGGASIVPPWLRFHIPLIEPDRQISRIRLSDKTSRFRVQRHLQLLDIYWSC